MDGFGNSAYDSYFLIIILLCSPKPADNTKEAKGSNLLKKVNARESTSRFQSKLISALAIQNSLPSILLTGTEEIPIFLESPKNPMLRITTNQNTTLSSLLTADQL
jgi:hypothetical protein